MATEEEGVAVFSDWDEGAVPAAPPAYGPSAVMDGSFEGFNVTCFATIPPGCTSLVASSIERISGRGENELYR